MLILFLISVAVCCYMYYNSSKNKEVLDKLFKKVCQEIDKKGGKILDENARQEIIEKVIQE